MLGLRFLDVDFMRINLACAPLLYRLYTQSKSQWRSYRLGRPKIDRVTERNVRRLLAKGVGILKVARSLGIGTGTVQRISNELG